MSMINSSRVKQPYDFGFSLFCLFFCSLSLSLSLYSILPPVFVRALLSFNIILTVSITRKTSRRQQQQQQTGSRLVQHDGWHGSSDLSLGPKVGAARRSRTWQRSTRAPPLLSAGRSCQTGCRQLGRPGRSG